MNILLVIILLILSATVAIFITTPNRLPNSPSKPQEQISSPSAEVIKESPHPTVSPELKPTPSPKPTTFSSPIPTPTPVPTIRQPLQTTKVYLGRSHNSIPESASGDGKIRLMSIDPYMSDDAKIASLQYSFVLRGLESEREYLIYICTIQEGGDCIGLATIKTDKSGNASHSGNSGITITKDRPFKAIKIVHLNEGFCSNSGSPCLRGELFLEIKF